MKQIKKKTANTIVNIKSVDDGENITLTADSSYYVESFYFTDIYDDKKIRQLVQNVKKAVRQSPQYLEYVSFLKTTLGLDKCAVLGNISSHEAAIEFHHYPYTLDDIVIVAINRNIALDIKFNSFSLAREIIRLHYKNHVGLVPLSTTIHQLVHAEQIFLNYNQIFGEVSEFNKVYGEYLDTEMINRFNKLFQISEEGQRNDINGVLDISHLKK